jgi:hypothetical protein
MDTWVWLVIMVVAVPAAFALVWWTSGRAPVRGRGSSLTPEQSEQLSLNQIRNRSNPPAPY